MALVDILIPTYGRKTGLAVVLTSLFGQTFGDFNVIVSDQTKEGETYLESIEIQTLALARMLSVIQIDKCGFVGCAATGLSYLDDIRPHQQQIEIWTGPVAPEPFEPNTIPWERHKVNNAANPLHLEQQLVTNGDLVRYKVAWIGGANVLYNRAKLLDVGGFSWWQRLPPEHAGEEVVVQFLLIRKYGGCGILPSGTYHLGLPTSIEDRRHNATELFEDLVKEFNVHPAVPMGGKT